MSVRKAPTDSVSSDSNETKKAKSSVPRNPFTLMQARREGKNVDWDPNNAKAGVSSAWRFAGDKLSLVYLNNHQKGAGPDATNTIRVAAFDMDGTLLVPKFSKSPFPQSRQDRTWWHSNVPTALKDAHAAGFQVVVFTNQKGVTTKSQKLSDLTGKAEDVISDLGIPISFYLALGADNFRKPDTGMWGIMARNIAAAFSSASSPSSSSSGLESKSAADENKNNSNQVKICMQESFFVGDAAVSSLIYTRIAFVHCISSSL